jgi:hypothetical protein
MSEQDATYRAAALLERLMRSPRPLTYRIERLPDVPSVWRRVRAGLPGRRRMGIVAGAVAVADGLDLSVAQE